MDRKEFFRQSGRWIILSGIGLVTTLLALDHKIVMAEECGESSPCKYCGKNKECNLPKAKQQLNGKEK
jgi:hypothetical protein